MGARRAYSVHQSGPLIEHNEFALTLKRDHYSQDASGSYGFTNSHGTEGT